MIRSVVRGRVFDQETGAPFSAVRIRITAYDVPVEVLTDSEGRYLAEILADRATRDLPVYGTPGSVNLYLYPQLPPGYALKDDLALRYPPQQPMEPHHLKRLTDDAEVTADLPLLRQRTLRGRVLSVDEKPAAEAAISYAFSAVPHRRMSLKSDEKGEFSLSSDGESDVSLRIVAEDGALQVEVLKSEWPEDSVRDFSLLPSSRIAGRVLDEVGDPVEDVSVALQMVLFDAEGLPMPTPFRKEVTDSSGRDEIKDVPAGQYLLHPIVGGETESARGMSWRNQDMELYENEPGRIMLLEAGENGSRMRISTSGSGRSWRGP